MTEVSPGPDTELTLTRGDLRLVVSPYGASLRGLSRAAGSTVEQIVTGYSGAKNKVGGQGDVLIPFPGRVTEGRYTFEGREHQMVKNDKETPSAIHGFLRTVIWEQQALSDEAVTFATALDADVHPGYPFSLQAQVTYQLTKTGLRCEFHLQNSGPGDAPVAAGFHPYFTVGSDLIDSDMLHVPFESTLEFENLIPTGNVLPVAGTPLDFRKPQTIGGTVFNTCYLHPLRDADGLLLIRLGDPETGQAITVSLDKAFDYVVLYSGDPLPESHRRRALAIEPMTCGSDAFNHPEWGLVALGPGEALNGAWEVTAE
jgi:aldose 1-epimerase